MGHSLQTFLLNWAWQCLGLGLSISIVLAVTLDSLAATGLNVGAEMRLSIFPLCHTACAGFLFSLIIPQTVLFMFPLG